MPTSWSITDQRRTTNLGANGQFVSGWEVSYTTSDGVHGSLFISDADYRPVTVAELIGNVVRNVTAVHHLSGEV